MIFLKNNVLLERELTFEDIKPRLLGHWGTCPGITLIYAHLNRIIKNTGLDSLLVVGPGELLHVMCFWTASLITNYRSRCPWYPCLPLARGLDLPILPTLRPRSGWTDKPYHEVQCTRGFPKVRCLLRIINMGHLTHESQSYQRGDPWVYPRRRRARLCPVRCIWCCDGQSTSRCHLYRWRR